MTTVGISSEQAALQRAVAEFLSGHGMRAEADGSPEEGYNRDAWLRAASIGLPGILIADRWGGLSLGWLEAAIVAYEGGRANWQSPFLFTTLATALLEEAGHPSLKGDWLPKIREGRVTCAVAVLESGYAWEPEQIAMSAEASSSAWVLNGAKHVVVDGFNADLILVLCRTGRERDALTAFCVPATQSGVHRQLLGTLDLARTQALLSFDRVHIDDSCRLGPLGGGWDLIEWILPRAALCIAAETVGIAAGALEMGVQYAKDREQFDRPIGYFQGVSHKLADSYRRVENATSLVLRTAEALDASEDGAQRLASMARVFASRTAREVVGVALQVHGGYGYTWANPLHRYWRRAISNAHLFGSADWHLSQLMTSADVADLDDLEEPRGVGGGDWRSTA
jgi:alkylation response protein AidB-like acyl-CoA dehydrogenase